MRARLFFPLGLFAVASALQSATAGSDGPAEAFARLRETYAALTGYRDEGQVEISSPGAPERRCDFSTEWSSGGEFRLDLAIDGRKSRIEGGKAGIFRVDLATGARSLSPSLAAAIDAELVPGAHEAFVALALAVGGAAEPPDAEALASDGEEACGVGRCQILSGSRDGGAIAFRLAVDPATSLLRRVAVDFGGGGGRRLRATLRPVALHEPALSERIEVAVVSADARVMYHGRAVLGLGRDDFRIRAGRRELEIASVEWVGADSGLDEAERAELEAQGIEPPPLGRTVIFFVQTDGETSRLKGQVRMLSEAKRFLSNLGVYDRIAVVSFDSHLKLRQDFTDDRERLGEALDAAIRFGPEPFPPHGRPPADSMARTFDFKGALAAANPERALELTARSLVPIEGDKMIVYLGWGLGRMGPMGIELPPAYDDARRALAEARATVFVLDVTDADYHSLEGGLRQIAEDTGGTYEKTNVFPVLATDRLIASVSGHYVVSFSRPADLPPGTPFEIELRDRSRGDIQSPQRQLP